MKVLIKWRRVTGVYCIKNVVNNKSYIGSSVNIEGRAYKHRSLLRNNKHENAYLQNAWNKYGEDCFHFFILETCSKEDLTTTEQKWIDLSGEYNLIKDVVRNVMSETSKIKMSNSRREGIANGTIPKYGIKSVQQFSLSGTFIKEYSSITEASSICGVSMTQLRRALQGVHRKAKGFQWKYTADDREIQEYIKRDYSCVSEKLCKKILVLDMLTGIYTEFESFKECASFFSLPSPSISQIHKSRYRLYKKRYKFL
jgi:group I intron endonuclease